MYVWRVPVLAVDAVIASTFSLLSLLIKVSLHKKTNQCTHRQLPLRGPRGVPWERSIGVPFLGSAVVDEVVVRRATTRKKEELRVSKLARRRHKRKTILRTILTRRWRRLMIRNDIIIIHSTSSPRPLRRTKPSSAPRASRNSSSKPSEKPSLCAGRDSPRTPSPPP